MDEQSESSLKETIKELLTILQQKPIHVMKLRQLTENMLEKVSLFQDKNSISILVCIYSLYKITARKPSISFDSLFPLFDELIRAEEKSARFRQLITKIFREIKRFDRQFEKYLTDTLEYAALKQGVRIYESGVSLTQAAEMMGVSKWSLTALLPNANLSEFDERSRIGVKARLDFTRGLFQ